jgi:hypothetical protein
MGAAKLLTAGGGGITLDAASTATDKTITIPAVTGVAMTAASNANNAQFNTITGTAPLYSARAWVNFNGTGTVAIYGSGNVTSITDNGTGDYTVNFTTAMPDANYAFVVGSVGLQNGAANQITSMYGSASGGAATKTTTQVRILSGYGSANSGIDNANQSICIFR